MQIERRTLENCDLVKISGRVDSFDARELLAALQAIQEQHGYISREAMALASEHTRVPLTQAYSADEAFVTGTFAGVIPVREIDGRAIGEGGGCGPVTRKLFDGYKALVARQCPTSTSEA